MRVKAVFQDIKKVEAQALVVGCYEDVRPLKGLAGEIDWLLCGALSQLLLAERFRGSAGELALLTPRGKLPVEKIFLVGLGPALPDPLEAIRPFARTAARALAGAGVTSSAVENIAPPGADDAAAVRSLQEGLREGNGGAGLDVLLLARDAAAYERIARLLNG